MDEKVNKWDELKRIIDEEVAAGRGELINFDNSIYGIKVHGYRITFFSTHNHTGVDRTWFERIPQEALAYYNDSLHPKVKGLLGNNNPFVNVMDGIQ